MLATHLVCWLVWWLHQNLLSLTSAWPGGQNMKFPNFANARTLAASAKNFFISKINTYI
jgi:hypothetical protein